MSKVSLIAFGTILASVFFSGCQSSPPKVQETQVQAAPPPTPTTNTNLWQVPAALPTYGSPTKESIQIIFFGRAVIRPGLYILKQDATVHDAIEAAGLFESFIEWHRPYSGLQRQKSDGSIETIWFTRGNRSMEERLPLKNGDILYISHEVF